MEQGTYIFYLNGSQIAFEFRPSLGQNMMHGVGYRQKNMVFAIHANLESSYHNKKILLES